VEIRLMIYTCYKRILHSKIHRYRICLALIYVSVWPWSTYLPDVHLHISLPGPSLQYVSAWPWSTSLLTLISWSTYLPDPDIRLCLTLVYVSAWPWSTALSDLFHISAWPWYMSLADPRLCFCLSWSTSLPDPSLCLCLADTPCQCLQGVAFWIKNSELLLS
jgi:hypothetical protein